MYRNLVNQIREAENVVELLTARFWEVRGLETKLVEENSEGDILPFLGKRLEMLDKDLQYWEGEVEELRTLLLSNPIHKIRYRLDKKFNRV